MGDTATASDAGVSDDSPPTHPRTIAVDGSAASGKSTVGRRVASALGYRFLDTGVMYRAVTLAALQSGIDPHDTETLTRLASDIAIDVSLPEPGSGQHSRIAIDGKDVTDHLRDHAIEEAVSLVSRVPGVRQALVHKQRQIAGRHPIVMAGRDIGTVVLANADVKLYLDAGIEERARRRYRDFLASGRDVTHEIVLDDIRRRDQMDSEREVSPLRAADDAIVIETDGLTLEEVVQQALVLVGYKG